MALVSQVVDQCWFLRRRRRTIFRITRVQCVIDARKYSLEDPVSKSTTGFSSSNFYVIRFRNNKMAFYGSARAKRGLYTYSLGPGMHGTYRSGNFAPAFGGKMEGKPILGVDLHQLHLFSQQLHIQLFRSFNSESHLRYRQATSPK